MKIVIVSYLRGFQNRMDTIDYDFLVYLKTHSRHTVYLYDASEYDEIKKNLIENSDAYLLIFTANIDYVKEFSNKKIYFIYDVACNCKYKCDGTYNKCRFKDQADYIKNNCFDYVFYKYETYITQKLTGSFVKYKFPHFMFDVNKYKNKHMNKEIDILFFGALYPEMYPFRNRLYYLLHKHTDKFNIKVLPYSKKHVNTMIRGHDLVNMINKSWLTIATKSLNNLLLAKYYEIAMSGSVVLGDYPDLEDEVFLMNNNMVYIDNNMTDDQIIDIIVNALKDKNKLLDIATNTEKYFTNTYSMDCGVKYFDDLIEKLQNNQSNI